ncbi:MAG TPA: farnesyl diphosphate synthase [Candidatus Acidoferrales bacterium]|nr:farnesyl diphosphate synthase [Candidatus Acidoferrales bacterium]
MKLPDFFEQDRALIEEALGRLLPEEHVAPATIHRAMRYSVLGGGKRLRPILCLEAARLFNDDATAGIAIGCALEFIHTYSLIHDDLPALDNDDLRRGRATCHKVFGDAMAILAGDALLTLAFDTLANAPVEPQRLIRVIAEIGAAAGTVGGMVGGQVADIEAERNSVNQEGLEYIHRSKTAALIRASVVAGAISSGAGDEEVECLRQFGENVGLAFQIVDDILDVEESSEALGKTAGKDEAQQKATYPALFGLEKSREIAADLGGNALKALDQYGERGARLRQLGELLVARRS